MKGGKHTHTHMIFATNLGGLLRRLGFVKKINAVFFRLDDSFAPKKNSNSQLV